MSGVVTTHHLDIELPRSPAGVTLFTRTACGIQFDHLVVNVESPGTATDCIVQALKWAEAVTEAIKEAGR